MCKKGKKWEKNLCNKIFNQLFVCLLCHAMIVKIRGKRKKEKYTVDCHCFKNYSVFITVLNLKKKDVMNVSFKNKHRQACTRTFIISYLEYGCRYPVHL